jgi:predicted glycoside hydrolase/deacetylase ChbG (UPF0249 family)
MSPISQATRPILCADDFGISASVSTGIAELAASRRVSAASAIVTLPNWQREGQRLASLRNRIAIGLHVNLTLGAPLTPAHDLAPSGTFSTVATLIKRCLTLRPPDAREVTLEVQRQVDRFEQVTGYAPDFIDGHQHVHILPGIRHAFLDAIQSVFPGRQPLIRNPGDGLLPIILRNGAIGKAVTVATLAAGFGSAVRTLGFPTNRGFSGFSAFDPAIPYAAELESYFRCTGHCHMIMCHPGYVDRELGERDGLVERRIDELRCLLSAPALPDRIWHVERRHDGHAPAWTNGNLASAAPVSALLTEGYVQSREVELS